MGHRRVVHVIDDEADVCSLGSGQPDRSQGRRVGQTDEADPLREASPDKLDGGLEICHVEFERIRPGARQHDDLRGLHAFTLVRAPKKPRAPPGTKRSSLAQ